MRIQIEKVARERKWKYKLEWKSEERILKEKVKGKSWVRKWRESKVRKNREEDAVIKWQTRVRKRLGRLTKYNRQSEVRKLREKSWLEKWSSKVDREDRVEWERKLREKN